jgi:hypothetical protein
MAALYQKMLKQNTNFEQNGTSSQNSAFLAFKVVISMIRGILNMNDWKNGPITIHAIISFYVVADAVTTLSDMYPGEETLIYEVKDLLKSLRQRGKLAGKADLHPIVDSQNSNRIIRNIL